MSPLEVLEQITRANPNRACDAIGFIREGGVISRQQFLPLFGKYMPWNYIVVLEAYARHPSCVEVQHWGLLHWKAHSLSS